jgi:hypothetical protein
MGLLLPVLVMRGWQYMNLARSAAPNHYKFLFAAAD